MYSDFIHHAYWMLNALKCTLKQSCDKIQHCNRNKKKFNNKPSYSSCVFSISYQFNTTETNIKKHSHGVMTLHQKISDITMKNLTDNQNFDTHRYHNKTLHINKKITKSVSRKSNQIMAHTMSKWVNKVCSLNCIKTIGRRVVFYDGFDKNQRWIKRT